MVKGIPENIRGMIEHLPSEQKVTFQAPVEKKKSHLSENVTPNFFLVQHEEIEVQTGGMTRCVM
jgi:hypothetical protein